MCLWLRFISATLFDNPNIRWRDRRRAEVEPRVMRRIAAKGSRKTATELCGGVGVAKAQIDRSDLHGRNDAPFESGPKTIGRLQEICPLPPAAAQEQVHTSPDRNLCHAFPAGLQRVETACGGPTCRQKPHAHQ